MEQKEDEHYCKECGEKLDGNIEYHLVYRVCDSNCYMKLVGMSWGDFI